MTKWLQFEIKFAEFSKSGDNQVSNLLIIWVARHQEHVSSDSLDKHSVSSDSWLAESNEDPGNVGGDNLVCGVWFIGPKSVKEIENTFLDKHVERLLVQSEMH